MKKIILASSSPRRKKLLSKLNIDFQAVPAKCEEKMEPGEEPLRMARRLSREKAESLVSHYPRHLIIGADTFVTLGKQVLGKPHTKKEAKRMLNSISGKTLRVITGFTIWDSERNKASSKTVQTKVVLKKLTSSEINKYVATGEPLDKAGAFAIQEMGGFFVKRIEGNHTNVVGLPLYEVAEELKKYGVKVF